MAECAASPSASQACHTPPINPQWARQRRQRQWLFWLPLGGLVLLALVFAAVLLFSPYDPNQIALQQRLQPASLKHLLGTDQFGRDVLTRLAHGAAL